MMTRSEIKSYTAVMCLLAFAYQMESDAPFVVTSNRDEFYLRPTLPLHWWPDKPILAGRDEQAGGTWLGLSKTGRFAAVTNFRDLKKQNTSATGLLSRGDLVVDFLSTSTPASKWAEQMQTSSFEYGPFSLLLFDGKQLIYCNNQGDPQQKLAPGFYALSNHQLNSPWPKVRYARDQITHLLKNNELNSETLPRVVNCLSQNAVYPDKSLPETGIPIDWERRLSSPFITADGYGTRASTGVIFSKSGVINIAEQSYHDGIESCYSVFQHKLSTD